MSMPKPTISSSQVSLWTKCPEAHRRSYVEGEKIPPGFKAHRGSGAHLAIEANLTTRMLTGGDESLPEEQVLEIARDGVHKSVADQGVRLEPGESRPMSALLGEAIDHAVASASLHYHKVAPTRHPVAVEAECVIEHDDFRMRVVIDEIDAGNYVRDHETGRVEWHPLIFDSKSTGKAPSLDAARSSVQLALYADAVATAGPQIIAGDWAKIPAEAEVTGELVVANDYLVIGRKTKKDEHVLVATKATAPMVSAAKARVAAMVAQLQAGNTAPAPPDAWWCSDKFCGYHSTCPFAMNRKVF